MATRIVTAHELARLIRRHERWHAFPYFALPLFVLVAIAMAVWFLGWVTGLVMAVCALSSFSLGLGYLTGYLLDILHGRAIHPIAGAIELALPTITVIVADVSTSFSIADVARARHIANMAFDDFNGLADVLELELTTGPKLRIPDTFRNFDDLRRALPTIEAVSVN